jgi:hypothetical protein
VTGREPFRIEPQAGPEAYKTYQVVPHLQTATCAEVGCERQRNGWRSRADVSTVDGQKIANWIRLKSGRRFTHTQAGPVVVFTFPAGQTCFARHKKPVERAPLLRVVGGDWRGNPTGMPTRELRPADWIDDFGTHQLSLAEAHKRG